MDEKGPLSTENRELATVAAFATYTTATLPNSTVETTKPTGETAQTPQSRRQRGILVTISRFLDYLINFFWHPTEILAFFANLQRKREQK